MQDEWYQEERKASLEAEYGDAEHYDKWLITLASGAFGISVAFIRYIAPNPDPATKIYLVLSWTFLLTSILATMASLQVSQLGFRRYREMLECLRDGNAPGTNYPAKWAHFLNLASLLLFIIGAAMLAIFSFLNL